MPKLGNTVEECLLARWYKQCGDTIAEGEPIAEIETDKATFELMAPAGGTLLGTFFETGDLVPVFATVCVVGTPGEDIEKFRPRKIPAAPQAEPLSKHKPVPERAVAAGFSPLTTGGIALSGTLPFSPRARRFAEEHHFYPEDIAGTGAGGRILERDVKELYYESLRSSPLAEKLMARGYQFRGESSGAHGRILSRDLEPPTDGLSPVRARIARRMKESLATTAQYTMNASARATGLLAVRGRIKILHEQKGFPSVNINEMVVYCATRALAAMPEINAELIQGRICRHSGIHIGFACDTPRGLLVPVIRDSQKLTLPELSLKMKALTRQVLEGSISPDDLSGGTFTVSNLGIYGVESFSPILNPPQVAILGVGTIGLKPIRIDGIVEFVEHIGLSLTCDHQVIDGAPGARFLNTLKEQIENIESIAELDSRFEIRERIRNL